MQINQFTLTGTNINLLTTEILYTLASVKAKDGDLIQFYLSEKIQNRVNTVTRILKGLKRQGKVQLFVSSSDFSSNDMTEIVYLLNKYPAVTDYINENMSFIIKL